MPNPNQGVGRFHKWLPQWLKATLFLFLHICITAAFSYGFILPSSVRVNLHNLKNGETYDAIFIGTSYGQYGIDLFSVDAASGSSSVSLCMADAYPDGIYHMLRLACETQSPSRVIYELNSSYWMNEQRSESTQIFFYQEFSVSRSKFLCFLDKIIDLGFRSALAPWGCYHNLIGQVPDHIHHGQGTAYKNYDPSALKTPRGYYADRGFIYRDQVANKDKGTFNDTPQDESQARSKAKLYFNRITAFCRKNDIELTVVTTLIPQETLDKFAGSYDQSHLYFKKLLEGLGLEYYNSNYMKPKLMDRSMKEHQDYDGHTDGIKAQEFGTLLDSFLNSLGQGSLTHSDYFIN